MEYKILKTLKTISKYIIIALMLILVLSMVLGTIDLVVVLGQSILSSDPYILLINVEDLYTVFSVILIIVVGYELFKSMSLLLHHDKIPVKSILQIAVIAMANKVITLNIKHITLDLMLGLSALILGIGVAFYFFNKSSENIE